MAVTYFHRKGLMRYNIQVVEGTWMQGIVLFSTTGDVIVRLPSAYNPFANKEHTFEVRSDQSCCELFGSPFFHAVHSLVNPTTLSLSSLFLHAAREAAGSFVNR
jgi:hypothetical protein